MTVEMSLRHGYYDGNEIRVVVDVLWDEHLGPQPLQRSDRFVGAFVGSWHDTKEVFPTEGELTSAHVS